jgi:hypothetical protein
MERKQDKQGFLLIVRPNLDTGPHNFFPLFLWGVIHSGCVLLGGEPINQRTTMRLWGQNKSHRLHNLTFNSRMDAP